MPVRPTPLRVGRLLLEWGTRTYVMGILNVTPDSFSGDGVIGVDAARACAQALVAGGADMLDIGGESTRPGAHPVPLEEELARSVGAWEMALLLSPRTKPPAQTLHPKQDNLVRPVGGTPAELRGLDPAAPQGTTDAEGTQVPDGALARTFAGLVRLGHEKVGAQDGKPVAVT